MRYWSSLRSRWLDIGQVLFFACLWTETKSCYNCSSASGQDKSNSPLWLATREGKTEWSYLARSGLPAVSRKKTFPESHIINSVSIDQVCSVKMAGYWPRSSPSPSINTQKNELGEYPAILTSHLVNNRYILTEQAWSIKGFIIISLWENFFLRDTVRSPERGARVVMINHNAEFDSSCPLAEQAIYSCFEKGCLPNGEKLTR